MAFPFGVVDRYQAIQAMASAEPEFAAVVGSCFVRVGDTWRLAFHQQSPST